MEQLRKFIAYVRPYKRTILAGIFFILCSMAFGLFVPYMVGKAVDDLGREITWNKIIYYPLVILGINFASGIFLFLQRRLLINTSRHIEFDMREDFYATLVNQPLEYFQANRVGDLMARATNDLAAIRQIVGPMILYSFQAIFALCISLPIMLNISVKLTLLLLIPMPLVSLTVKFLGEQIHRRFEKIQEFFSDITARAQENLTGVRVVRAYAQEDAEIEQFQVLNREYADTESAARKIRRGDAPAAVLFYRTWVCNHCCGRRADGRSRRDHCRRFYVLYSISPADDLVSDRTRICRKSLSTRHGVAQTIQRDPRGRTGDQGCRRYHEQPPIKGKIEFHDLTFAYNGKPVLHDINLVIEQGRTVAFVGKTGSGKSTLVGLIPRLHDAPNGSVLVDGRPLCEFPLAQLRRAIGFVPQETFLFSDTLADNIAFGVENFESDRRTDARENKWECSCSRRNYAGYGHKYFFLASQRLSGVMPVERAAEIAGLADDVAEFPGKYEQLVGERGITLSGGQKQRTAIARAVMRDPRILILDDSLSAVGHVHRGDDPP